MLFVHGVMREKRGKINGLKWKEVTEDDTVKKITRGVLQYRSAKGM